MGDSEKVMGLKKAYAEMILNSAKEAAARVMVAERKALRYQRELADSKEEAVRMMVRLKHMMDSRIYEADKCQQGKIDELEAQLHEAEDIVKDLREELAMVRDELHAVRKIQSQQISEREANHIVIRGNEEFGEEIDPPISDCNHNYVSNVQAKHVVTSELEKLLDQKIGKSIQEGQSETHQVKNLDMAPFVNPVKELEVLENGSSERMLEVTHDVFTNDNGLHGNSHPVTDDHIVREDFENGDKSATQISSAEVTVPERKSHSRVKHDKKSSKQFHVAMKLTARTRRIKKIKNTSSLRKRQSLAKVLKSLQKTNLVTSKSNPFSVVSSPVIEPDGPEELELPLKTVETYTGLHGPIQPCSQFTPKNDKSNMGKASNGEENGSADSSVTCADPETDCVPSCSIIEETDALDADDGFQPQNDRPMKITFQRKRKNECMDNADENEIVVVERPSDGNTLLLQTNVEFNTNGLFSKSSQPIESKENTLKELKRSLKRKNVDRQDLMTSMKDVGFPTDSEPKAIGIVPKATRDGRRLAQVARQLLSMSDKKW